MTDYSDDFDFDPLNEPEGHPLGDNVTPLETNESGKKPPKKKKRRHGDADEKAENEPKPLVSPQALSIAKFIDEEPPPQRWLLNQVMPLGVVGILAAGGGTGKSMLTLQMAMSVASGEPFMGMEITEPGPVIILAAEDESEVLWRRTNAILTRYKAEMTEAQYADFRDKIKRRLGIVSRVGEDNRLTIEGMDRNTHQTKTVDRIADLANHTYEEPLKMLVLDPASRFRSGDENDNDAATRFVEAVEQLRSRTGATILLPHHVSQGGLTAGADRLGPEVLRGATALLDGVRWAAAMATLRKDEAKKYGVNEADAARYVRFDVVKNNYAPPWEGQWLYRHNGGSLSASTLANEGASDSEQQRRQIIEALTELLQRHGPLTSRQIRDRFAGKTGPLGAGEKTVSRSIETAIEKGELVAERSDHGPGKVISLPADDDL